MSEKTKTIKVPEQLTRQGVVEMDAEKKTVRISISSDTPYERYDWWNDERYYEVLDHSPSGINDGRLKAGLPMLFNHNREKHLGRAASYDNNGSRITVSDLSWSESELAKEKRVDMEKGVLVDTSVGYSLIGDGECIGAKDGIPIYKFKWEPHEFSLVTIPADFSVGVGRERGEKPTTQPREIAIRGAQFDKINKTGDNPPMPDPVVPPVNEPKIDIVAVQKSAREEFKAKCKKIDDYVANLKNEQWKAAAAVVANKHKEGEADFDEFRTEAINAFDGVHKVEGRSLDIGMSLKEARQFSLIRAARQLASPKGRLEGLEKEASEAAAKIYNRTDCANGAIMIPNEVATLDLASCLPGMRGGIDGVLLRELLAIRAQTAGSFSAGGATVQTQYGPMIEILNNAMVLNQIGVTMINGLVGDFVLPQQTGGATAYHVSETGAITDSEATFAQKSMTPHRIGATIPYSTQFLAQTSISAEAFLRTELMTRLALLKDLDGLLGTGVAGQPLGVANTTGINATVTYGGAATWVDVVEHETGIAVDNADIGSMAFILDAASVGKWKTILKDSVAGAGYLISDTMTANGYPVKRTNQISAAHQSFFGVWAQLLIGSWAGMEFIVDPYALKKSGQIEITVNELFDVLVRQPLAFNVSTDAANQG